jgi:hypothetical protein
MYNIGFVHFGIWFIQRSYGTCKKKGPKLEPFTVGSRCKVCIDLPFLSFLLQYCPDRSSWSEHELTTYASPVYPCSPDSPVKLCKSWEEAMDYLSSLELNADLEKVWVIGGSSIYQVRSKPSNLSKCRSTRDLKTRKLRGAFPFSFWR